MATISKGYFESPHDFLMNVSGFSSNASFKTVLKTPPSLNINFSMDWREAGFFGGKRTSPFPK